MTCSMLSIISNMKISFSIKMNAKYISYNSFLILNNKQVFKHIIYLNVVLFKTKNILIKSAQEMNDKISFNINQ